MPIQLLPPLEPGAVAGGVRSVVVLTSAEVLARRSRLGRGVLLLASLLALRASSRWEGPVLVEFRVGRGLTTTDVAAFAGLCRVVALSRAARRSPAVAPRRLRRR